MELSQRERMLLKILIGLVAAIALFYIIVKPMLSIKSSVESGRSAGVERLNELENLYQQYKTTQDKLAETNRLMDDTRGVSALVEENAEKTGILSNKVYNRDKEANLQNKFKKITTEVKFEGVNIKSALDFLYYMENSGKMIHTSSLRINQAVKERSSYDVTLSFESYKKQ